MRALLNSGKYKVTEILYSDETRDVCLCADVTVKSDDIVIVNTFKGKRAISEYLPIFFGVTKNEMRDFRELITSEGAFSAVFDYYAGIPFGEYYKIGEKPDYYKSVAIAEKLLLRAMECDLYDDKIAACVLSEENAVVIPSENDIRFNYKIIPFETPEDNFKGKRLGGMLRKMFPKDRLLPIEIEELIAELYEGKIGSCKAAYAKWRELSESRDNTRKAYEKESFTQYLSRKAREKRKK